MSRTLNIYAHRPACQDLLYVIFARREHFRWCLILCNEKCSVRLQLSFEDLQIRSGLKVFRFLPPTSHFSSSYPSHPRLLSFLFSKNMVGEQREGLLGLADILAQALTESIQPSPSCFPSVLVTIPLSLFFSLFFLLRKIQLKLTSVPSLPLFCVWVTTTAWPLASGVGLHAGTKPRPLKWSVQNLTTGQPGQPPNPSIFWALLLCLIPYHCQNCPHGAFIHLLLLLWLQDVT